MSDTYEVQSYHETYEIEQRMALLAPADVASAQRWAQYMLEKMADMGIVVRLDAK